jgi:hypothetical protein
MTALFYYCVFQRRRQRLITTCGYFGPFDGAVLFLDRYAAGGLHGPVSYRNGYYQILGQKLSSLGR